MEMAEHPFKIHAMPYVPGQVRGVLHHGVSNASSASILIITHSEINALQCKPAGIIVVDAAPLSHLMIQLLGLGIPTVTLDAQQASALEDGVEVVINGENGLITTNLEETIPSFSKPALPAVDKTLTTLDGVAVHLRASVRSVASARQAVTAGAEAIGLVRSEFFMPEDGNLPTVDYYRQVFGDLCKAVDNLPVTIRLIDIAPDKLPQSVSDQANVGGALGLQGVRLFDIEPVRSIFHAQLDAINELSHSGTICLLIPYLVSKEEVRYWVNYIRDYLSKPFVIGAMVETPAGALDFVNWLDIVDFVAIGTNDLMQCLFAADRDRPELRRYLDPYAPLLYRFLKQLIVDGKPHVDKIQLCGVLSQLPGVLPILLGLGYRIFSVDIALISYLRQMTNETNMRQAEELANKICAATDRNQVLKLLKLHATD